MKMKSLSKVDLPREKLQKYGVKKLQNFELLALLLGSGIKGINVLELSKIILKTIQKIGVEKITLEDLKEIKGLGPAKSSELIAVLELVNRFAEKEKVEILSPEDVWKSCADIRDSKKEHFVVFYLDTQNKLIERQIISIGTLNASLVHPREVFEPAIALHTASIIIAHNHPSGAIEPSLEDIDVTTRLKEAGQILGIQLVDHIILSKTSHLSFAQQDLI